MKTFKSITDLEQLRNRPFHATIESLVAPVIAEYSEYRPEEDGYLVLIEPGDTDRVLDNLDMPWRIFNKSLLSILRSSVYDNANI